MGTPIGTRKNNYNTVCIMYIFKALYAGSRCSPYRRITKGLNTMPKATKATKATKAAKTAKAAVVANPHAANVAALLSHNKGNPAWPTKTAGAMPAAALLATCATLAKAGSNKWLALAMYARPGGATTPQVCAVLNGPHINCWRQMPTAIKAQVKQGNLFAYTLNLTGKPGAA